MDTLVQYGAGFAISFYVIKELINILSGVVKSKKPTLEQELKETARDKIKDTYDFVTEIKEPFWHTLKQVEDMHSIITCKTNGVPLVYHKQLEDLMTALNTNIRELSTTIKNLGDNCKLKQRF